MKLAELVRNVEPLAIEGPTDREITGITYDSRRVMPGNLFVAVRGGRADGHQFGSSEQGCNPAITVAPILLGKSDNFFPEPLFGVCQFGYGPLSRSRLTHYPTRTPLRYSQLVL